MNLHDTLAECLKHFVYADRMNAAMHCADVRYSPITFRVAEQMKRLHDGSWGVEVDAVLDHVTLHRGQYEEDRGR